jgi:hypothetical protein
MSKAKPRRLAGKSARCAPPEKPFALFEIPPDEIFWNWKRVFLAVRFCHMAEADGASPKAAAAI